MSIIIADVTKNQVDFPTWFRMADDMFALDVPADRLGFVLPEELFRSMYDRGDTIFAALDRVRSLSLGA